MDRAGLEQRLMAVFLRELQEHVRALEKGLLDLEGAPQEARTELFAALFRSAHSLKGAARSVGIRPIEAACHRLEEIFGWARDGLLPLEGSLFRQLLGVVDALGDAGRRLSEGEKPSTDEFARLLEPLTSSSRADASSETPPSPPPTPRTQPPGQRAPDAQQRSDGYVRIASDKLDALLARSSELLVARGRAHARRLDAAALEDALKQWRREGARLRRALKLLGRRESEDLQGGRKSPGVLLELDRLLDDARRLERDAQQLGGRLEADRHAFDHAAELLDNEVRSARMLPFAQGCEGLARVLRDVAATEGKHAELLVQGGDLELDRAILDGLRDPLLHLVRNAAIHGIETPAARRAAGKPEVGRVVVSAELREGRIAVSVSDDGAGIDLEAVRAWLRENGQPEPSGERGAMQAVFLPGFSTSPVVSNLSGRGVGLDVVKSNVEAMRGSVEAGSELSRGASFTMSLPLTLTTIRALLFRAAGRIFAVDSAHVRKLARIDHGEVRFAEGREVVAAGSAPTPIVALAELLGLDRSSQPVPEKLQIVLLESNQETAAFVVDEFLAEQEIVVRDLGPRLPRIRHLSGASILASGGVALILNVAELVGSAAHRRPAQPLGAEREAPSAGKGKRVLVVEESITTRALEKSILESAGYDVLSAADGAEAWQLLTEHAVDLVVSDVEMPRMDGYALTEAIRASPGLRDLPVILVTARASEEDRARGVRAGASAYLVKSALDQATLIEAVEQML